MKKHITIIGGGNLGKALALGLQKAALGAGITVTGRKQRNLQLLQDEGIETSTSNLEGAQKADYLILCVQPAQVATVLAEIGSTLTDQQVVISTATGVKIEEMVAALPNTPKVVRAMPNTAAAIGQSMTCLAGTALQEEEWAEVESIFNCIGITLRIDEEMMQAATVLGASGIAFFLRYLRAATQGGIQMGFHPKEAQMIATQTALGAASLLKSGHAHPEQEIDKVTTPRGCTIEGLNEMEHQGLSSAVIKGLMASYHKISQIR